MLELLSLDYLLLFVAAIFAGALNAVAGGGTFIALPALMMSGVPALAATITIAVSLTPGIIASSVGYRKQLHVYRKFLPWLGLIGLVGSWIGAEILLATSNHQFDQIVPWLMLVATILFTFGKAVTRWTDQFFQHHLMPRSARYIFGALIMCAVAVYGGFFGAGMGILMLAMMQCMGLANIHEMNGLKTLLGVAIRLASVTAFILAGNLMWAEIIIMSIGAVIGGYYAAYLALKLPEKWVRQFVVVIACVTTLWFFLR